MNAIDRTHKPAPFGTHLGRVVIAGVETDVFSNGDTAHVGTQHSLDDNGKFLGVKYQCVEFVRRYTWLRHGINLASYWQGKHASEWADYTSFRAMGLANVSPTDVAPGDIAVFSGGAHGHVAIVADEDAHGFTAITGQNLYNDARDLMTPLTPEIINIQAPLNDAAGNSYYLKSFLRLKSPLRVPG